MDRILGEQWRWWGEEEEGEDGEPEGRSVMSAEWREGRISRQMFYSKGGIIAD